MDSSSKGAPLGGAIYTLAQSRTTEKVKSAKIVTGKGSDLTDGLTAEGRAKRKFVTVSMVLSLVDIAKEKKDKEMETIFWNAFHCQRKITSVNGIIYGNYCKNRCCTVCLSIRKAELINRYYPVMSEWEQPYFLTLTVKACYAKRLPLMMGKMIKAFQLINDRQTKRHKRGKGIKLIGVRALESNYNAIMRTYNPHFHLIVKDREIAEVLLTEWLKQWTPRYAKRAAQDIQPVRNLTTNLIEIIKYGSKIFTEPDLKLKSKNEKGTRKIYVKALYNILKAMKGRRLFDRFGFDVESSKRETVGASVITDFTEWVYIPKKMDWIDRKTGETLTNYNPPVDLLELLSYGIDKEVQ
jgi:hypothetical protein